MKTNIITGFLLLTFGSGLWAETLSMRKFPKDFLFGVATAAYQIEGAWNADGKAESNWDRLSHTRPDLIKDGSNGDVACDSYHQLERDVEMLKNLGVDYYRFSLSWSRILTKLFNDHVNEGGINYYNNLINLLLKNKIKPIVTIYHWDLPQSLQDLGGFTNPILVDEFTRYAKVAFERFGDRVKLWTTFNEPHVLCFYGYGDVSLAPAYNLSGIADYPCAYNVLKAHSEVYHLYNDTFRDKQHGRISIALDSPWYEPASNTSEDVAAAKRGMEFELGIFAHPIYSQAGYFPEIVKEYVTSYSAAQGYVQSRLPQFTQQEVKRIRGTHDHFCINHYVVVLATDKNFDSSDEVSADKDKNINISYDHSWPATAHSFNKVVPWAITKLLKHVKTQYGDLEIYITENGLGDFGGIYDFNRVSYFHKYLNAILDAIQDGVRVKAYTAWSLMDNYEWSSGYTVKFGLYKVDFSSPNRTRTPKASAQYYKWVIASRIPEGKMDYKIRSKDECLGLQIVHSK